MRADLRQRLLIGPILATVTLGSLVWDYHSGLHLGWFAFLCLCIIFGSPEFRRLASLVAGPVQLAPMIGVGLALLMGTFITNSPWFAQHQPELTQILTRLPFHLTVIALGVVWVILAQMRARGVEHFFTNVALTCLGFLYIGVCCCMLLTMAMGGGSAGYYGVDGDPTHIVHPHRGIQLLMVLLVSCKLGDVTAYFGGHAFGRHKMAPGISPGKTWEGFAASFIGSIGGAYLVTWIWSQFSAYSPFNGWWQPAVWGLIIGPLGVVGDLAESCMKRQAGVKDSGTTLPGFGGWLDIFDAIILAAPVGVILALLI